jgi:hypothetical protein
MASTRIVLDAAPECRLSLRHFKTGSIFTTRAPDGTMTALPLSMTSGWMLLCTVALFTTAACGTDAGVLTLGLDAASDVTADAADAASSADTPSAAADAEADLVNDTVSDTATDASTDTGGGTTTDVATDTTTDASTDTAVDPVSDGDPPQCIVECRVVGTDLWSSEDLLVEPLDTV